MVVLSLIHSLFVPELLKQQKYRLLSILHTISQHELPIANIYNSGVIVLEPCLRRFFALKISEIRVIMHLRKANHSFEKIVLVLCNVLEQIFCLKNIWNQA